MPARAGPRTLGRLGLAALEVNLLTCAAAAAAAWAPAELR